MRDDSALGPTEDLNRKPGSFPHRVMAATALFAIVTAGLVFVALVASSTAALVLVAILR